MDAIVPQDRPRHEQVTVRHHQPPGQDAERSFKHAHVLVQRKGLDPLGRQKVGGAGDQQRIGGAQKLFHDPGKLRPCCECVHGVAMACDERGSLMGMNENVSKPLDRLSAELAGDMERVNALIRSRMASRHAPRIPEVTAHLVEAGGKRLRPMLVLAASRLCGYEGEAHVLLAAAVEFIHTATLLHDDVVDESEQRRGRPTANLLWDNKSSVLVGDYLFARSFQLMAETGSMEVMHILSNASATIAEGEVLQLTAAQDITTTEDTYIQIVRGKTAALFSAATEAGAVVAHADKTVQQALFGYGDALGIAFQIVDDLLDYSGSSTTIGKNVGDDFRERKLTLPVIKAIARADATERAFWERTIGKGQQDEADLTTALEILHRREALDASRADAIAWAERAKTALLATPDQPLRQILSDLADFVVSRLS